MSSERIESGYAALQTDSSDAPTVVSGVAIGEGDITHGGSGKKTLWPRETLEKAADGLQGQPLATNYDHDANDPRPQTPTEAIVGEVQWSGYKPGVGVLFEAEVDDPDIARSIENGRLEVSPLISREVEPLEEHEKADYKATSIHQWRDLATVVDGAAPSNEITVGSQPMKAEALHEAVESLQEGINLTPPEEVQGHAQDVLDWRSDDDKDVQGMTDTGWNRAEQLASGEELSVQDVQDISAWFARHGSEEYDLNEEGMDPWEDNGRVAIKGWGGPPMRSWIMDKREQLVEADELEALSEHMEAMKEMHGLTFESTGDGTLDESDIPSEDFEGHYLYPGDTKTESSYPVVDGDGVLRKGNVDAAHQLGCRGACPSAEDHDAILMDLAQEFDSVPEWAMEDSESMGSLTDAEAAEPLGLTISDDGENEPNSPEHDGRPTSNAESLTMADISEKEEEFLESLADYEEPKIVEQSEYEALETKAERVSEVRGVLEESLAEQTSLKEETISSLDFEALASEFEDEDGEMQVEALRQVPETEAPEEEEDDFEALKEDADMDKAEALYQDYQTHQLGSVEGLKDDIVEALGVDDFDKAKEVLD